MSEEKEPTKSLAEQIVDETLASISKHEDFSDEIVQCVREILAEGSLKRPEQVLDALKPQPEVEA